MIFFTEDKILGGLAGIYYGIEAIPKEWAASSWINIIARKEDITQLFEKYLSFLN